jgi:2-amino-4-hydroxy-6-hydroxymethyldihydropteridine diphosphokinase
MVILGLGSNLGDRALNLKEALGRLGNVLTHMKASRLYETRALLPENAPGEWDINYLNLAVMGETTLSASDLLAAAKRIEREMGRKPSKKWAPRIIDIDILAMDEAVVDTLELRIPHSHLLDRDFALLPFAELAPEWRWPVAGELKGKAVSDIVTAKGYRCGGALSETGIILHAQA